MRTRRSNLAVVAALALASTLAACSFEAGDLEPVGRESEAVESTTAPDTDTELQTVTAEHLTAGVPADWQSVGDADGWSYVHQLDDGDGGVAGRIGFIPGGTPMSAQEAIDWFISSVEETGATNDDYAPTTTLRTGEDRANTSYTYQSAGQEYRGQVWAISDSNGIPSLIQLSGTPEVITPELVAQVDESLDVTGVWSGSTP
ncbi:hypothetical protein [Streptomyces mayteni]